MAGLADLSQYWVPQTASLANLPFGQPQAWPAADPGPVRQLPEPRFAETLRHGPTMQAYKPTWQENIGQALIGDQRPSFGKERAVEGLVGSTGLGSSMSLADFTPAGNVLAFQAATNPWMAALAALPAAGLVKGAVKGLMKPAIRHAGEEVSMASRSANIYDPPVRTARPFEADYPNGAPGNAALGERLTHDIDGRPIQAKYVVGRRVVGGADEALTPEEINAIATELTGGRVAAVAKSQIGGNAGLLRSDGSGHAIFIDKGLRPDQGEKVLAHETGHLIDGLSGPTSLDGRIQEARKVFNELNNTTLAGARRDYPAAKPEDARNFRNFGPEKQGYGPSKVEEELRAELTRGYMANPNFFKTDAKNAAANIRARAYANPWLRDLIHFNGLAGLGVLGAGGAATMGGLGGLSDAPGS